MRIPTPQANKCARSLACSSAGSGRLYANKQPTAQPRQHLTAFVLKKPTVVSQSIGHPCHQAADSHAAASPAARKSP